MTSLTRDILLIFVSFYSIPHETTCLKLGSVEVPQVALTGQSVNLTCPFSLDGDKLYSVMWYKDHEEFYRFVPRNAPRQHSYKLEGFQVDVMRSNDQQVGLKELTLKASGMYRCEVSAEAPSFHSDSAESAMQVISIPEEDPEICGAQSSYDIWDVMALNCTSGRSYPPAQLEWFINGKPAISTSDFEDWFESSDLVSSTSTLSLVLVPQHFVNGQMTVRCVATVGPVQSSVRIAPTLVNHRETSLLVQARGSSASRNTVVGFYVMALTVTSTLRLLDATR